MSSSPFDLFRRNLKPFMVFATLLALISFVVLPILQTYLQQRSGAGSDAVVAKYTGMELTQSRVNYFTQNHAATVRFLADLANETIKRGGVPRTSGFQYDTQAKQIRSLGINENPNDAGTIRTFMFADEARKAGFELDDNALQVWLERFTDGLISQSEITARLMKETGNRMGPPHLYEQLRNHLLADVYLRRGNAVLFGSQGPLLTPDEQWTNFLKLNQNAVAKTYGILVNDYVEKTDAEPPKSRIDEVYLEGRDRDPNDQASEPGFHKRYTAKFEYLVGNYQTFLDEEIAKLSDDAIRAEYDRRLKGGDFQLPAEVPAAEVPVAEVPVAEVPAAVEPAAVEPAAEERTEAEPEAEMTEEKVEEPAADKEKPAEKEAVEEKPAEEAPAEEAPAEEAPAEEASAEEEPAEVTPADEVSSVVLRSDAVRLVVFQDDDADAETEKPTTDEPASEVKKPAEEKADEPAKTEEKPAEKEEEPKADEPMEEEPKTEEPKPEEPKKEEPKKEEPKVQTFEDVRDEIATDLAGPAARDRMDKAVTQVASAMRNYFSRVGVYKSNLAVGKKVDPPARPDFAKLAGELGLTFATIGPHSEVTISEEPVADSFEVGTEFGRRGPSFTIMMYGFDNGQTQLAMQPLFSPVRSADDQSGKVYVSWKTEETEAYTPTLDEVRDEVVMAIRMEKARELATQAAAEIVTKANAGTPLSELIPEEKMSNLNENLGPFTWMDSFGFQGATIGNVPQLDSVGHEFMKAVFTTDESKFASAPNGPGRVVYVVQPTKFEPSTEELRRQFKQPVNRMMARMVATDIGDIRQGYYESLDKSTGFEEINLEEK